jgi:hypothetical protein
MLLVLGAACVITYAQTGHFRIGSYGGMLLISKGLMVASPLPPENSMSALNWVADETKPAQVALSGTSSIPLKVLMVSQYTTSSTSLQKKLGILEKREPARKPEVVAST